MYTPAYIGRGGDRCVARHISIHLCVRLCVRVRVCVYTMADICILYIDCRRDVRGQRNEPGLPPPF